MSTKVKTKKETSTNKKNNEIGNFFGQIYSFTDSLKLYHWHVTGKGSYAQHMALDQALDSLRDVLDRLVETTYSMMGDISITIPETPTPTDIITHVSDFYKCVEYQRELFSEDFTASIIDDCQEAIQQLLYRLRRLQ